MTMTETLTAQQILDADDKTAERVEVPEWGGGVYVRSMTGSERDQFEQAFARARGPNRAGEVPNIRAWLAVKTVCNEAGERLFTDAQIPALGAKSARALDRVFTAAMRVCGISESDVQELEGN